MSNVCPLLLASASLLAPPQEVATFEAEFPDGVERTWIGPGFHGNRLQDWRLANGRLECVQSAEAKPCRVVHALDTSLSAEGESFDLSVRLAPLDEGPLPSGRTWAGFLIGAGAADIDHRLTALVHHRPAADGGMIAAVDDQGLATFRDFEHNVQQGNWGITGKLDDDECALVPGQIRSGPGYKARTGSAVRLDLHARRVDESWTLTLRVVDEGSERELSQSVLENLEDRHIDGSLALVSHRGPSGSSRGYWFDDFKAAGENLVLHEGREFGPIWAVQYTTSASVLKMTAQLPPLSLDREHVGTLELLEPDGEWHEVDRSTLVRPSNTLAFRVEGWGREAWQRLESVPYRVRFHLPTGPEATREFTWDGTIRAEPRGREFVLAAFTGNKHFTGGIHWNSNGVWFPHEELTDAVLSHDPDLLFFSGDQIYEGDLTGAQRRPLETAMLDYHDKWLRWCWAFQDLMRDRPTICIPDDHDVYHGNLWGAGGRAAKNQDAGGYTMPPDFVRMVERTQTSHLPDPYDPRPVEQGIGVYYTDLRYGGISFAILEDRKFKSSATPTVPAGDVKNGWFQNEDFDPVTEADVPGAVLLGERQLAFLNDWSTDWSDGVWMKVCLSQTIFANVATLPAKAKSGAVLPGLARPGPDDYPEGDRFAADCDSNGWPQTGRNRALRELRRGFAFHVAGDQHLGSFVRYGVDDFDDAGFALCVPSIANTWPRRWYPPTEGGNRRPGSPRYTGQFLDGFGNHVTVHAVSNPVVSGREPAALHDRAPGYGIVRFDRESRDITVECWPRGIDPTGPSAQQYPGWPVVVNQRDGYARQPLGYLPTLEIHGFETPVVQVIAEDSGEIVYTIRLAEPRFRPPVFAEGKHTVRVGEPESWIWQGTLERTTEDDVLRIGRR